MSSSSGKCIAVYFTSWSIYDRKFNLYDIDWRKVTHIYYAFAGIEADGRIKLMDPWADVEKRFLESGDTLNDPNDWLFGNFGVAFKLKQKHRHVKFGLSIGGWSLSQNFKAASSSPQARTTFVNSALEHVQNLGLDCLDLDWEFPTTADIPNYLALVSHLSSTLKKSFPNFSLSIATPARADGECNDWLMSESFSPLVDHFNLMAYDFAGSWSDVCNHHSNLRSTSVSPMSVEKVLNYYLKVLRVDPDKLVLGIPAYARAFEDTKGIGKKCCKPPQKPGSWGENGVYDFKTQEVKSGPYAFSYDKEAEAGFYYNAGDKHLVSMECEASVRAKIQFAIGDLGLKGIFFWEASGDDSSLLNMAHSEFSRLNLIDDTSRINNCISFPQSKYPNIAKNIVIQ